MKIKKIIEKGSYVIANNIKTDAIINPMSHNWSIRFRLTLSIKWPANKLKYILGHKWAKVSNAKSSGCPVFSYTHKDKAKLVIEEPSKDKVCPIHKKINFLLF